MVIAKSVVMLLVGLVVVCYLLLVFGPLDEILIGQFSELVAPSSVRGLYAAFVSWTVMGFALGAVLNGLTLLLPPDHSELRVTERLHHCVRVGIQTGGLTCGTMILLAGFLSGLTHPERLGLTMIESDLVGTVLLSIILLLVVIWGWGITLRDLVDKVPQPRDPNLVERIAGKLLAFSKTSPK